MHLLHPIGTVLVSKYVVQLRKIAVFAVVIESKATEFTYMPYILICYLCYHVECRVCCSVTTCKLERLIIVRPFSLPDSYSGHFHIVMPPPLGAVGIMFLGCPSVRLCVRPPEARITLFPPVHGSIGPSDQPWPFFSLSVRPVRFRAFPGERMEDYPKNLYTDVSWPASELIRFWSSCYVASPHYGAPLL